MKLYDRIYYTLYRMTLKLADMFEMKRETPRTEVALMLSLLTAFNIIPIIFLFSFLTRVPVFSGKKIYIMIALLPIALFNFLMIFYKNRYKDIEEDLSARWGKEKRRNILITIFYIVLTVIFLWLSLRFIMGKR